MHKLGVKRFFDVYGTMRISLKGINHGYLTRAAITFDELTDAIISKMRIEQDESIKRIIRKDESLRKSVDEISDKVIDKLYKAMEKNRFDVFVKEEKVKTEIDYKAYYESIPILIDFIMEQARVGNKKADETLKSWDDSRLGGEKENE